MKIINIIKPEFLFITSALLAISPYSMWLIYGENELYNVSINYHALQIWVAGILSFFIGSFSQRNSKKNSVIFDYSIIYSNHRYNKYLLFLWVLQTIGVIYVYKGIPIVQYLFSSASVSDANIMQRDGFLGQFGLYFITNILLVAILSINISISKFSEKKYYLITIITIFAIIFGFSIAGKRQGLVIAFLIFTVSSIFYYHIHSYKIKKMPIMIFALILFFIFGLFGKVRTQGEIQMSSLEQITSYLQYPLINFEWQLNNYGITPDEFNLKPILSGILPYKILVNDADIGFGESVYGFRYPENGIGAGIYGPIHLAGGIYAIILFSFFLGFFTKYVYRKACYDWRWVLPYAVTIWPLFSAHSYNHFIGLLFYWIPFFLLIFLPKLYKRSRKYNLNK